MEEVKEAPLTPSIEAVGGYDEPRTPEFKQDHGVTLIPRPSDDPRDPLVRPPHLLGTKRLCITDLELELAYEQESWHRRCTLLGCIFWFCSSSGRSTQCQASICSLQAVNYSHRMASMLYPPLHLQSFH